MTPRELSWRLGHGADPNEAFRSRDGQEVTGSPLSRLATGNPDPTIVRMLLAAGAEPDAADCANVTPLLLSAWFNPNPEVIRTLLAGGADARRSDGNGGRTLLYLLAGRSDIGPDVFSKLLVAGVPANARILGHTVIARAAASTSDPEVVRLLVQAGADPRARDWLDGSTALAVAAANPNPRVADALIRVGG